MSFEMQEVESQDVELALSISGNLNLTLLLPRCGIGPVCFHSWKPDRGTWTCSRSFVFRFQPHNRPNLLVALTNRHAGQTADLLMHHPPPPRLLPDGTGYQSLTISSATSTTWQTMFPSTARLSSREMHCGMGQAVGD